MADEKLNVSPEENPQPSLFDTGSADAPAPETTTMVALGMLELVRSKGVETTLPLVVTTVTRTPSWLCQTSVLVPLPIPPPPPSMFPSPVASTVMPVDNTRMSARISGKMVFCSCFM